MRAPGDLDKNSFESKDRIHAVFIVTKHLEAAALPKCVECYRLYDLERNNKLPRHMPSCLYRQEEATEERTN
jgi:hypothetical protein